MNKLGVDHEFAKILKSVMETEVPPETVSRENIDLLVKNGFMDEHDNEHGNRKFHVTERGALFYSQSFLRLSTKTLK